MASRASALLGSLLDRLLPSGRRRSGRSFAWGAASRWSGSWAPQQDRAGDPGPADDAVPAAPSPKVPVTVVGPVPPGSAEPVVDGTIEDDGSGTSGAGDDGPPPEDGPPGPVGDADGPEPQDAHDVPAAAAMPAPLPRQRRLRDDALPAVAIALTGIVVLGSIRYHEQIGGWLEGQRVQQAARAFAQAWQGGRLDQITYDEASLPAATPDERSAEVARRSAQATAGLTAASPDRPSQVDLLGSPDLAPEGSGPGRTATQRARVTWRLDDGRAWRYTTTFALRARGNRWRTVWSPAALHPDLTASTGLLAERVQPPRAPILGAGDRPLMATGTVHLITYTRTGWITRYGDLTTLAKLVEVDAGRLTDRVTSVPRGTAVEVAVLRPARWSKVRTKVTAIRGTHEETVRRPLAPSPTYAHSLLGDAVPATTGSAAASGGRVRAGDLVGVTGLQLKFDERLRGTAGLRVVLAPLPAGGSLAPRSVRDGDATTAGRLGPDLAGPTPGTPLRLTLDHDVQAAAQSAVDGVRARSAMVAVDVRTGAVLAIASNVDEEWDRALLGSYPPGSTFKIVTTWALTGQGVTAAEPMPCPATITVDGNPFRNADRAPGGVHPLARQFAMSCNTAFAGLGSRVTGEALQTAARELGFGVPAGSLGVGAFAGSVPTPQTAAKHAAALIGQDRVSVSPLSVAVASATVAGGRYRSPQLVLDVPREDPTTGPELDAGRLRTLRSLMCETVRSGTARALRRAPGAAVAGKTGTAQFGHPDPVGAHAWFTGYQGDIAFAVVVERGGSGAGAAVPVAMRFLRGVNGDVRPRPASSCGPATAAIAADR
jgi:hypothetical protein